MKTFLSFFAAICLLQITSFSQNNSSVGGEDKVTIYSRPGKFHELLAELVGSWKFSGAHFEWVDSVTSRVAVNVSGTAIRKPFANGRYFVVEVTSDSTLPLPIQDGKMIIGHYQEIQTEGYDNVKNKFQITLISNHNGSAINFREGAYDPMTKTIILDGESEDVPGEKMKGRTLFKFIDIDHYKLEYYLEFMGKYYKITETNYTRIKTK